ncbi:MAG TPA: hypothetical protein VK673_06670 [Chthoniobacterales bacterium]|nr:hypothetical protein [Chthoniobacterales bacterium]
MAMSLCLCLPVRAIDPARLHMKPFGHPAELNPVLGPERPKATLRPQRSVIPIFQSEKLAAPQWIALGPDPIPNGQTYTSHGTAPPSQEVPVSGRVSAIAVDPTDPQIIYVGGAQGGVYRSLNGGKTWDQLIQGANALNFAIGSITVDPTDSTRVLIGTGEGNLSADSYFGVGIYLVTGAKSKTPKLNGPYNLTSASENAFANRSIVKILVDPNNNSIVFCATSSGVGGLGAQTGASLPPRGLYRSTNFAGANPTFDRLTVGPGTNVICTSAAMDPTNPDHVVCSLFGQVTGSGGSNVQGGLYYSTNATAATPTFTLATVTGGPEIDNNLAILVNVKLDISPDGQTILAATDEYDTNQQDQGLLRESTDGGQTYPTILTAADGFAGGQGFYNVAIAIDQTNSQNVYLAGTLSSTGVDPDGPPGHGYMYIDGQVIANPGPNPQATGHGPPNGGGIFQYSTDGGTTFTPSVAKLHADSHAIAISKSDPKVIYTGNDGGVWASSDSSKKWRDINTKGFSATQFESIAVHPTNKNFSIGGTQDNGTIFFKPDGSVVRADFGDGGYALIDQSATNTEEVTMYHTYFNVTNDLIGFSRVLKTSCAQEGEWSFLGRYTGDVDPTVHCDGTTDRFNGIQLTDSVNFYAPMALGPGTPNTVYFGTDTLYWSNDQGNTMFPVSASPIEPGVPISAIGVSPMNDSIRVVGLDDGSVYATVTGGALVNLNVGLPIYVTRVVMDPMNPDVVYLCYNGYLIPGAVTVLQITNLSAAVANPANAIINVIGPPVSFATSVNGFAVDPQNNQHLFASTDQGVYASLDGGNIWALLGTGLPDVEIFDLKLQSPSRTLRAATHGLGVWEISISSLK